MADDKSLVLLPAAKQQLAQSLVSAINAKHLEGLECDEQLREAVERKLRVTVECGQLIQEAQATFRSRFDEVVGRFLGFAPLALRSYVKIAKRRSPTRDFRSDWQKIRDAAEPTNLIPVRDGHGPQKSHAPNFFTISTRWLQSLLGDYRKYLSSNPLDTWAPETLEQFAAQLKSVVDVYSQVQRQLANYRRGL